MKSWEDDKEFDLWPDVCIVCGAELPDDPKPGSVQEQGYCSIRCKKWDDREFTDDFDR